MKSALARLLAIAWSSSLASALGRAGASSGAGAQGRTIAAVTPVQKAAELLQGLLQRAREEKHAEQVQFSAFKQFCGDVSAEKQSGIEKMDAEIERLQAKVLKHDADADRLGGEVKDLEQDIVDRGQDLEEATKVRKEERTNHTTVYEDYTESINAIASAIDVLKAQARNTPQAKVQLTQLASRRILPDPAWRAIAAFLSRDSEDPDLTFVTPPEAYAYESKSQSIISMLEELKTKFQTERQQLEKQEMERQHAYEMLALDLRNSKSTAKSEKESKEKGIANSNMLSVESSSALQDVTATRSEDAKYLTELTTTCKEKSDDFAQRQELRGEEIQSLTKAHELLTSEAVAGAADEHLPAAAAAAAASSLLQLGSSPNGESGERRAMLAQHAASLLREAADRLNSRALASLATRAVDGNDPFEKVKRLIEELLQRLKAEEGEEAEHKGWCDSELATNEQTRKEKTMEVDQLRADIDGLEVDIPELAKDIAALSADVAQIHSDVANATAIREEERTQNQDTIADAVGAQSAVAEAISVLKEFYDKAGQATALVQSRVHSSQAPPPIFDSPYKGLQGESGGVLALLDVIKSDFARLESETSAAESAAQRQYDEFVKESEILKTQKESDIDHLQEKKQKKEGALLDKKTDLENAEGELSAALETYDKLKPACLDTGMSYEERVRRRKEEIEALKEALRILEGEDIAL